jgi:hypothetical protein
MMLYIAALALVATLISVGAGLAARRCLRLPLIWSVLIGAFVFVGLSLVPIPTHAVIVTLPRNSN